jgi:DNA-binding transcriptional LysR family regulator
MKDWGDWDLAELGGFVAVVEHRSFARAAEELGVPRSSLWGRVAQFEARVGTALLDRSGGTVRLTDAGARMYEHASRALRELAQAQVAVGGLSVEPVGSLRVAAPAAFAAAVLMPIVARFVASHPGVDVSVRAVEAADPPLNDDVDVALRASGDPPPGCVARLLARYDWRLYAAPAYLDAAGAPGAPRELASHRVVVVGEAPSHEPAHARLSHARTRAWQDVAAAHYVAASGLQEAFAALVAGAGVGALPGYLAAPAVAAGTLREVLPAWRPVHAPPAVLHAVTRRARQPVPKVAAFVDALARELAPTLRRAAAPAPR